jgi:serine/threonine-protein kinase
MSPPAGVVDGLLAGRYRLVHLLGSGATGEVWRAHDERLDRDVAVKVLRPELAEDDEVRSRVLAHARSVRRLHSPGVAAVLDVAEDDQGAWLVVELVDGEPLSAVLRRDGRLPTARTLDLLEQAARVLQAAHDAGVVHRHLTPGNVLLQRDGGLRLTDFGLAHAAGAVPPAGREVGAGADLQALGAVAYECLSGRSPLGQPPPARLPEDVPRPVAELVQRLLAEDPAQQPPSAGRVELEAAALRRDQAAASATAAPTDSAPPRAAVLGLGARPGQRRAVRVTAVALALLAVVLGVRDALDDDASAEEGLRQPGSSSSVPADGTSGG